jgi:hypothetical protein
MSMKIISSGLEQYPQTRPSVCGRMVWRLRTQGLHVEAQDSYLPPSRCGPATQPTTCA